MEVGEGSDRIGAQQLFDERTLEVVRVGKEGMDGCRSDSIISTALKGIMKHCVQTDWAVVFPSHSMYDLTPDNYLGLAC